MKIHVNKALEILKLAIQDPAQVSPEDLKLAMTLSISNPYDNPPPIGHEFLVQILASERGRPVYPDTPPLAYGTYIWTGPQEYHTTVSLNSTSTHTQILPKKADTTQADGKELVR